MSFRVGMCFSHLWVCVCKHICSFDICLFSLIKYVSRSVSFALETFLISFLSLWLLSLVFSSSSHHFSPESLLRQPLEEGLCIALWACFTPTFIDSTLDTDKTHSCSAHIPVSVTAWNGKCHENLLTTISHNSWKSHHGTFQQNSPRSYKFQNNNSESEFHNLLCLHVLQSV